MADSQGLCGIGPLWVIIIQSAAIAPIYLPMIDHARVAIGVFRSQAQTVRLASTTVPVPSTSSVGCSKVVIGLTGFEGLDSA